MMLIKEVFRKFGHWSSTPHDPLKDGNCFDLLRLLFALGVLYSHSIWIGGIGTDHFSLFAKNQIGAGYFCVYCFFAISGFLIPASFENSKSVLSFTTKRFFRIVPAFWVCLIATTCVFAPIIAFLNPDAIGIKWIGDNSSWSYFNSNLFVKINQWSISGTLNSLPVPENINGSLWSLYPEIECYVVVGILGVLGALTKQRHFLLLVWLLCVFFNLHNFALDKAEKIGPAFLTYQDHGTFYLTFLTGSLVYFYRKEFKLTPSIGGISLLILLLSLHSGGFLILGPIFIPIVVIGFGSMLNIRLKHDFSYGVYIYGFLFQQCLAAVGIQSLPLFILLSIAGSLLLGVASWFIIEKPSISLGKSIVKWLAKHQL